MDWQLEYCARAVADRNGDDRRAVPSGPSSPVASQAEAARGSASSRHTPQAVHPPVGGPVSAGWREGTLTRARELTTLCEWAAVNTEVAESWLFVDSITRHLEAAREAAELAKAHPRDRLPRFRTGALRERAKSNLDAAEAQLLNFAPPDYLLGQLPGLLTHVQCHLIPSDPRRTEFERLARRLGVHDADHPPAKGADRPQARAAVQGGAPHGSCGRNAGTIVSAVRAASSASMREQVRVRSFRDVLVVTSALDGRCSSSPSAVIGLRVADPDPAVLRAGGRGRGRRRVPDRAVRALLHVGAG